MQEKGHRIVERQRGWAVFKSKSGLESENIKKSTQSIFQEIQLKIIIRYNLKIVDYLEVTLLLQILLTVHSAKQIFK